MSTRAAPETGISEEREGLLQPENNDATAAPLSINGDSVVPTHEPARVTFIRILALLCACSLSIGAHFGRDLLGPLKSRLSREMGTDNTDFSLLVAAFSLNSTWTPLLGGILASKLGSTFTSILATGVIFLGQAFLLVGHLAGSIRLMTFGMFVFGLGVSPLSVAQEAIIVRFFKSHGLGVGLAFGLVAGKAASFVSARTSYPLSEHFGPHAPFVVATGLAAFSVIMNAVLIAASRWLVHGTGAELEANELQDEARKRAQFSLSEAEALEEVARKKRVVINDIYRLGDVFWAYVALNIFCGMIWTPFTHLAANIFQQRYGMDEFDAGAKASYLLAGSVFLYPICGFVVDRIKVKDIILKLLVLSSCLTLSSYIWLALPPTLTGTPVPAVGLGGLAHGFSPLLLVVLVPQIVPMKYVSTTLGAHKSLENIGSTIMQTVAGLTLDGTDKKASVHKSDHAIQNLLNGFVFFNVLQLIGVLVVWRLQKRAVARTQRRRRESTILSERPPSGVMKESEDIGPSPDSTSEPQPRLDERAPYPPSSSLEQAHRPLLTSRTSSYSPPSSVEVVSVKERTREAAEARRGRNFASICAGLLVFAWVLFLGTAWVKLRSRADQANGGVH